MNVRDQVFAYERQAFLPRLAVRKLHERHDGVRGWVGGDCLRDSVGGGTGLVRDVWIHFFGVKEGEKMR